MGAFLSWWIYNFYKKSLGNLFFYKNFYYLYKFLSKKWYFDIIYNKYVVFNLLKFGYHISFKMIDRGFFELLGPLGIVRILNNISVYISFLQSGLIFHYILIIFISFVIFILWYSNIYSLEFELILIYLIVFLVDIKIIIKKK
jgi:hypothetical protein